MCHIFKLAVFCLAAAQAQTQPMTSTFTSQVFGTLPDGRPAHIFTLVNRRGTELRITDFGGIVVSLKTPDRAGKMDDIILGFDTLEEYVKTKRYFGATVGRFANRIAGARFTLDGVRYTLARNNGENSLHGGVRGFYKTLWTSREVAADPPALELSYLSPDGEEGFPGNLKTVVTFTLDDENALRIDYRSETDKPTVVNFTNHSFFNLAGQSSGSVLDQVVTIDADRFTPVGPGLIPTGELRNVGGTPFDFRSPTLIGLHIQAAHGYDHNWVLNHHAGQLAFAARAVDPKSGRSMDVFTTEPGLQFFSGNTLDGTGKNGAAYGPYSGFCMETQHFPDSPNRPSFPSTVLRPGDRFHSTTIYRFGIEHGERH